MQVQESRYAPGTSDNAASARSSKRLNVFTASQGSLDLFAEIFQGIAASQAVAPPPPAIPKPAEVPLAPDEAEAATEDASASTEDESLSNEDDATLLVAPVQPPVIPVAVATVPKSIDGRDHSSAEAAIKVDHQTSVTDAKTSNQGQPTAEQPELVKQGIDSTEPELVSKDQVSELPSPSAILAGNDRSIRRVVNSDARPSQPEAAPVQPMVSDSQSASLENESALDQLQKTGEADEPLMGMPTDAPQVQPPEAGRRGSRDRRERGSEREPGATAMSRTQDVQVNTGERATQVAALTSEMATRPVGEPIDPASVASTSANTSTPAALAAAAVVSSGAPATVAVASTSSGSSSVSSKAAPTVDAASPAPMRNVSVAEGETSATASSGSSRQTDLADRVRLVHRIAKAFQKMGIDGGQVRLKMHPEDLGSVQLEMQVSGNKVSATVSAESDEAAQLLQNSLAELRQRLEAQGLIVEKLEVARRPEEDRSGSSRQSLGQESFGGGTQNQGGYRDSAGGFGGWSGSWRSRADNRIPSPVPAESERQAVSRSAALPVLGGPIDRSIDLQI